MSDVLQKIIVIDPDQFAFHLRADFLSLPINAADLAEMLCSSGVPSHRREVTNADAPCSREASMAWNSPFVTFTRRFIRPRAGRQAKVFGGLVLGCIEADFSKQMRI